MKPAKRLLANRRFRQIASIIVIVLTFGLFGYYLATHPEVLRSVLGLDAGTLLLLGLAYLATIAANAFVLFVSLRLIDKRVDYTENLVLTGYSSIVNFFGPLQSGPGFRAAYLKDRHNVGLKRFFAVTLAFYGFFALINGTVLLVALLLNATSLISILVTVTIIILIATLSTGLLRIRRVRDAVRSFRLDSLDFWLIGVGAVALSLATSIAYFIELRHVDSAVTFAQSVVYTAAANLALFVSLTPGAIGFRESFLLISQRLHDIPSNVVIAASIIDRAFYICFLLVLFVVLLAFGVRRRLSRPQS